MPIDNFTYYTKDGKSHRDVYPQSIINLRKKKDDIEKIEFDGSVKKISEPLRLSSLKEIIIKDGVSELCERAFEGSEIYDIIIPNSVQSIGARAFACCRNLSKVILPNSIDIIRKETFKWTRIEKIEIPDSVVSIEENAFMNCSNLSEVKLSNNLVEIGNGTFGCSWKNGQNRLKSITIPNSVKTIGEGAFSDCSSLEEIKFEGNFNVIESELSKNCSIMKIVLILNSLKTIRSHTFASCGKLHTIVLPYGIKIIELLQGGIKIELPKNITKMKYRDKSNKGKTVEFLM